VKLPSVDRFDSLPDAVLADLRAGLRHASFGQPVIDQIEAILPGAPGGVRLPILRNQLHRRTEPGLRMALLLTYGGALDRAEIDSFFGSPAVESLLAAGLLVPHQDRLRFPFRLVPLEPLWVLADDVLDQPGSVMPPGPTTGLLVRVMPRECGGTVLDVGCGPGSLALVAAARGASRAIGTDINPRAIVMARLNARLNELAAEFRTGDTFEPVRGERFDLVVSQPPFIMRPDDVEEIQFLHGGPRGDSVTLGVLRGAAAALTPRGECLVLADIALRADEEVGPYLAGELREAGLDVLALDTAGLAPDMHAVLYAKHATETTGPEYLKEVQRYLAHSEGQGIRAYRQTLIVARRAAPDARELRLTPLPVRDLAAATSAVRATLWRSIEGSCDSDTDLLRRCVRVAPDAEWMSIRGAPEGEQREHRVRFGPAWPALEQIVTDEGLMLSSLLERSPDVATAISGYAELCEATPAEVRAPLLAYIRQSLLGGMLVFAENGRVS